MHLGILILPKFAVPKELLAWWVWWGEQSNRALFSPFSVTWSLGAQEGRRCCISAPAFPAGEPGPGGPRMARLELAVQLGREQAGTGFLQPSACSFSQLLLQWLPFCRIIPSCFEAGEEAGVDEDPNLCGVQHLSWGTQSEIIEIFQETDLFLTI